MTPRQAIRKLHDLARQWPDGISLVSANGSLLVVDDKSGRVLDHIDIPNDGGDPNVETCEDGNEYIVY